MSAIAPTTEFGPNDVSDAGLVELRSLSLQAMKSTPRFGQWLHGWCDAEQLRRATGATTATYAHALCLPLMADWSDVDAAGALEAMAVLPHVVQEFTASQFSERVQMAVMMEAALRLKQRGPEGKKDAH